MSDQNSIRPPVGRAASTAPDIYVARQAIYDRQQRLAGYELFYRSGRSESYDASNGDCATAQVLVNALLTMGLDEITDGSQVHIRFTTSMLLGQYVTAFPRKSLALREHPEDIPALAAYFLDKFRKRTKRRVNGIAPRARDLLCRYEWPGNVRELENAIERAVVMGVTDLLVPEDFPEIFEIHGPDLSERPDTLQSIMTDAKRRAIVRALEQAHGNQNEAAQLLDIHPVHLSKTIKALGLRAARRAQGDR